jgi:ribosomal protein L11 methyltransferase
MTTHIAIINHQNLEETELFFQVAYQEYNCLGIEEINLIEEEIEALMPGEAGPFVLHQLPPDAHDKLMSQIRPTKYYFASREDFEGFSETLRDYGNNSITEQLIEDQDWNAEWKKHYAPIIISESLRIVPSWFDSIQNEDLIIYPGQGFGTGSHETTYLCLKLLLENRELFKENINVLDFGCGSGILGIATRKLLNAKVVYCDIDSSALENTAQNILLNGLLQYQDQIIARNEFVSDKKYNLVFANILYSALVEEKELIVGSVNDNGVLILSGLLNHQVEDILKHYLIDFDLLEVMQKNDWSAIILKKK